MRIVRSFLVAVTALPSLALVAHAAPATLPPVLVKLINVTYGPDPDGQHGSPSTVTSLTAKYEKVAEAFEARWAQVSARAAEVDKAIAAGDALAQAGKYDDAIAAVAAVITPIARDAHGQLPRKRDVLEVRDAELPAVMAWSRYAEAKHDIAQAPDIAAAIWLRRKLAADKLDEELAWFADVETKSLGFLAIDENDPEQARIKKALAASDHLLEDAHAAAWGYYKSLPDHFGLVKTAAEDTSKAKKGSAVLMDVGPTKIDDKSLSFTQDEEWQEPVSCQETNKIDAIDPETGTVTYKQSCTYRTVSRHTELRGTFAAPPPAWARGTADEPVTITIAAKVDKPGPKWVLSSVRVLDFRFIKGGDDNAAANILDMMGQGDN